MDRQENLDFILRYLLDERGERTDALPASLHEKQRLMRALMNMWEPREIGADFLTRQDAELQLQAEEKGIVTPPRTGLQIWQGDITRLQVDAIVNAANAQGLGCWAPLHSCIDNCIHSAAGIQIRKECYEQLQGRLIQTGEAIMTQGYNLPAKHVIHTVGPIISLTPNPSPKGEGSVYTLDGRKANASSKGIVIKDGKKIIKK